MLESLAMESIYLCASMSYLNRSYQWSIYLSHARREEEGVIKKYIRRVHRTVGASSLCGIIHSTPLT